VPELLLKKYLKMNHIMIELFNS